MRCGWITRRTAWPAPHSERSACQRPSGREWDRHNSDAAYHGGSGPASIRIPAADRNPATRGEPRASRVPVARIPPIDPATFSEPRRARLRSRATGHIPAGSFGSASSSRCAAQNEDPARSTYFSQVGLYLSTIGSDPRRAPTHIPAQMQWPRASTQQPP